MVHTMMKVTQMLLQVLALNTGHILASIHLEMLRSTQLLKVCWQHLISLCHKWSPVSLILLFRHDQKHLLAPVLLETWATGAVQ